MLLRSLTKHVRDQNWFAVFLDFFIVVAGILIAFQITNWNEARQDRAREAHYLERLDKEFDVIRARLEDGTDVFADSVGKIDLLLKARRDYANNIETALPIDDVLTGAIIRVNSGRVPASSPAAFKEMIANGALESLRNDELRHALFAYDEFANVALAGWQSIREGQHNAWNNVISYLDIAAPDGFDVPISTGYGDVEIVAFNRSGFLENSEVSGHLTSLLSAQVNQHSLAERQLELAEQVETLIGQERK